MIQFIKVTCFIKFINTSTWKNKIERMRTCIKAKIILRYSDSNASHLFSSAPTSEIACRQSRIPAPPPHPPQAPPSSPCVDALLPLILPNPQKKKKNQSFIQFSLTTTNPTYPDPANPFHSPTH